LKAGLLALGATPLPGALPYGYYALAFIAGYNVDSFMRKIETIASEIWGIDKSRSTKSSEHDINNNFPKD